jgi:hypothetical protein
MTRRGLLAAAGGAALPLRAAETIEAFGLRWTVPVAADWRVEPSEAGEVLRLRVARPLTQPRRPTQFALAETPEFRQVDFEVEARKEGFAERRRRTSLILVYAWQAPDRFNYVHLSVDAALRAAHHNGVFHVFGGERVRISPLEGPPTLREGVWHAVRLSFDGGAGKVRAWVDGETSPSLSASDESLRQGRIGLGSFFDYGEFRRFRIIQSVAA